MSADQMVPPPANSGFSFRDSTGNWLLGKTKLIGLGLASVVLLNACGADTSTPLVPPPPPPPPIPVYANISGLVASSATGTAIVGAQASISVPVTTTNPTGVMTSATDATGTFLLSRVPASSRTLVHITESGFVDGFPVINAVLDNTSSLASQLLPIAANDPITVATGGTATVSGSPAAIVVSANSLAMDNGTAATGTATVSITPYDPSQSLDSMPGDFTSSNNQPIESFGAIAVTSANSSGNALNLVAGQTATIRIPYATRNHSTPPSSLSLFYFDTTTGYWVAQGTANLIGTAPNQYYQGTVNHLGIWTAGQVISPTVTINGCVTNEGSNTPAGNVRVVAEGISYSGQSSAITAADGTFHMSVKPNSSVIVNGQLGNRVTDTLTQSATTSSVTMPQCLSLATLSGAPRITLTWGLTPRDLDSHLFAPDGTHIYYVDKGTLTADPFIKLDVDNTNSFGPEVVTVTRLMVGTYTYGVRNFSGETAPGITGSPTRVEFRQGAALTVFTPTAAMGETSSDDWWTVFKFTVDVHCNITVTPVNIFSPGGDSGPTSPTIPAAVARQYCTP